jgi:hypothetical protein
MKNVLIISSIALLASVAQAGNGSGTMGVAARISQQLLDGSLVSVKVAALNPDRTMELEIATLTEAGLEPVVVRETINPYLVSQELQRTLIDSAIGNKWMSVSNTACK